MPLEIKPVPKLTYKLRLSPQMRLSLNLLQLPLIKLKEYVREEIEKNPLLEELRPIREKSEMPWSKEDAEKREYMKSLITSPSTLQEHLLRQLRIRASSDEKQKIGELIVGNINGDGYLSCPIEDIVESCKMAKGRVEKTLALVQTFDPTGVAARDLRECLLLQLKARGQENSLAWRIVDKYLPILERRGYEEIAKKLKVPVKRIREAVVDIVRLEPKPGRSFGPERSVHLIPDAMVRKGKGGYEVILNNRELPHLRISDRYKKMLNEEGTPEDAREYLRKRLNAARSLIDAITRRNDTIKEVLEEVVRVQKNFLDSGAPYLKPMTLPQIASRVGKHKSTVSRAINNKYLQTPQGILELRYFLSSGVKQKGKEPFSSKAIQSKVGHLIKEENKQKPLSDREITDQIKGEGISVSRRAITKYRTQLKILSSRSRRE